MTNYLGGDETTLKASGVDTHDGEKELPSSVELVVDDFERASLGDDYRGNESIASIDSNIALEGSQSLQLAFSGRASVGRFPDTSLQFGDSFEHKIQLTDSSDRARLNLFSDTVSGDPFDGTCVAILVDGEFGAIEIESRVNDGLQSSDRTSVPKSDFFNQPLTLRGEVTVDGNITITLINSSGSELGTINHDIDSRIGESGGVVYGIRNRNTTGEVYHDGPFITRRTTEELSERKRGATETSKLETAGGVGAGPRELPENEPAGILADQGVTSDLPAGTNVGYGLQLNGERGLELRAEADGSGGVQNSVVDLSGLNSDLRLGTGQSIEDGSGANRIDIQSAGTRIRDQNGLGIFRAESGKGLMFTDLLFNTGQSIKDGSGTDRVTINTIGTEIKDEIGRNCFQARESGLTQISVYSDSDYRVFDQNGGFEAYRYKTSSTAPGTLELTNAKLNTDSNDIYSTGSQVIRALGENSDTLLALGISTGGDLQLNSPDKTDFPEFTLNRKADGEAQLFLNGGTELAGRDNAGNETTLT